MGNVDKLLADLYRLYQEQGDIPSAQDYREHGNYPLDWVYDSDELGGFVDARKQAGIDGELEYGAPMKVEPERVLTDIRGLWMHLGRVPSTTDYKEYGRYSMRPVYNHFEGFVDARGKANVYEGNLWHVDKDDLIERLQTLYEELGREPMIYDYWERVSNDHDAFNEYGGFTKLKKEAGVYEGRYGNEAREVTREQMIEDLREKADDVDGPLSIEDYRRDGDHSVPTVIAEFGSFVTARAEAGLESSSLLYRTGSDHPRHTGNDKDIYKLARYRKNRPEVLHRDSYECQHCGMDSDTHIKRYGRDLHCHHIYPTSLVEYPDDSIHAMGNMVSLCREHHDLYERWFMGPAELLERYGPE